MSKEKGHNNLIPELRFPEFEGKGEWVRKKLGEFLEFKNGINAKREQYGKGIKFINVLDIIQNPFITYDKIIGSVEITEKEISKNEVSYGDILFQRSSETREDAGQANVYLDKERRAVFGGFVIRGKKKHEYDPVFMNYLLKTEVARKEITSRSAGSTRFNIGQDSLNEVEIFFPKSKPEQQKIAATLTSLDNLIAAENEKLEALKAHKRGLLQQLFPAKGEKVPKVRFGEFSGEWEERTLGDIGSPLMCKRIFKEQTNTDPTDSVPFYKIGTFGKVADAYIPMELFKEFKSKYSYPNIGDILISASGTIGRLVIYDGADSYYQDSNIVWLGHDESDVNNSFLYYYYSTVKWQTSDGGVIKRLYNSNLKEMVIFYPKEKEEQKKITNCLSSLDNMIAAQSEKIELITEHKKGLMQQLFPTV